MFRTRLTLRHAAPAVLIAFTATAFAYSRPVSPIDSNPIQPPLDPVVGQYTCPPPPCPKANSSNPLDCQKSGSTWVCFNTP